MSIEDLKEAISQIDHASEEVHSDKQHEIHALFSSANKDSIFQKPSHFDFKSIK